MQGVILAGGLGTRLRPVVGAETPKPMALFAGRPFVEYLVLQLRRDGCREVCLLTGHGAAAVERHFGAGQALGMSIRYSVEQEPLGTGGALVAALPMLRGERFLVMNGDSFLGVRLRDVVQAHIRAQADAMSSGGPDALVTMALVDVPDVGRFGAVELGADGAVRAFREKSDSTGAGVINAGIYVIERRLLEGLVPGPRSLERDIFPPLTDGRLRGVVLRAPFVDMGTPETYAALREDPSQLLQLTTEGA